MQSRTAKDVIRRLKFRFATDAAEVEDDPTAYDWAAAGLHSLQRFSCAVGRSLSLWPRMPHHAWRCLCCWCVSCLLACLSCIALHASHHAAAGQPFRFAFSSFLPSSVDCHSMHGIVCQSECSSALHCLRFLSSAVSGLPTYQPAMPSCISHDMPAQLLQLVFVCCLKCANGRSFAY